MYWTGAALPHSSLGSEDASVLQPSSASVLQPSREESSCSLMQLTRPDVSFGSMEHLLKLSVGHNLSPDLRGIMWKWVWKITCPAAAPLLTTKLNESHWVAFIIALLSNGTLEHMAATTGGGVASSDGKWHFGMIKECPGVNGWESNMHRHTSSS